MGYQYITEDNLENKQKYNYSKYAGEEFINDYVKSRKYVIEAMNIVSESHVTYTELKQIQGCLLNNKEIDLDTKILLDAYVKSFEVRKRLYSAYDDSWRPLCEEYRDYYCYIIFAQVLESAYELNHNLKYLNCMLKLDDTLISLISHMPNSCNMELKKILEKELELFSKIKSNGLEK